jgi:UPF0755 protein
MSKAPGKDVIVQVDAGMSDSQLGQMLEEKGLIPDKTLFVAQLKLSAYEKKIKPGIYTLNTSKTAKEMMQDMATVDKSTEGTESIKAKR